MSDAIEFPLANESDANDVAMAVTTANALWRQGESAEAIRWLRRAAEAAEAVGDDLRAVSLARSAAELQDDVEAERPTPPPAPEPVQAAASTSNRPRPPSNWPPPQAKAAMSTSSRPPPPTTPSAIPAARMVSISKDGSSPTVRAVPAAHAAAARAVPQSDAPAAAVQSGPPDGGGRSDPPPELKASDPPPAVRYPDPAPIARDVAPGAETHAAVRVSVEPSPSDRDLLFVRILREGEQPPIGAREALLVPLQSGVDLRYL